MWPLFQFKWLRRYVRKNTQPIPYKKAHRWRRRLSLGYAFIAWNLMAYLGYQYYKGENIEPASEMERNMSPSQRFALSQGIERATVMRIRGLQKVAESEFRIENYKNLIEKENTVTDAVIVEENLDEFEWNTQQNVDEGTIQ